MWPHHSNHISHQCVNHYVTLRTDPVLYDLSSYPTPFLSVSGIEAKTQIKSCLNQIQPKSAMDGILFAMIGRWGEFSGGLYNRHTVTQYLWAKHRTQHARLQMIRFLPFSILGALTDLILPVKEHIVDGNSLGRVYHLPYPDREYSLLAVWLIMVGGGKSLLWDGCGVWGPDCLASTVCIHPRENVKQI